MLNGLDFSADELYTRLIGALGRLRRRLRWRDGLEALLCRWWPVALIALLVQLVARWQPVERASLYTALLLGGGLLAWLVWAAFRPLSLHRVALRADLEGRLRERLTTALELFTHPPAPLTPLHRRQLHDAVQVAEQAARRPELIFPFRRPNRHLALWAGLLALTAALLVFPNPQDRVLAERRAVREMARQEAARIQQVRDELARQTAGLPDEDRARLLQELAELAARLRQNPGNLDQALADLERARAALQARLDPQAGTKEAALSHLADQLARLSQQRTGGERPPADVTEALATLAGLADSASPQARAETAATLRAEAMRVAAADPELARALTELADALEAGDASAANAAAQAAADAMRAAERNLALQRDLARALNELERSRAALSQGVSRAQATGRNGAGMNNGAGASNTSQRTDQPGVSGGTSQSPGQGTGQQPGGGGGTRADRLPPATRQGRFGGADPNLAGPGALEGAYEPRVFAPLAGPRSDEVDVLPGQMGTEGEIRVREGTDPGAGLPADTLVPLQDVLPAYRSAQAEALERSYIPAGLKSYVRDYFAALGE